MNLPRFFAAGLGDGAVTALDNANRLMQVPIDVLASGPAIALYPTLALLASQERYSQMRQELAQTLRRILVMTLLATALLIALREPLIRMLLEHGRFTPEDSRLTTNVLFCYCFGIVGLSVQRLLARGFYALGETKAPVVIGVAMMVFFCAGSLGIVNLLPHVPQWKGHAPAALALNAALTLTVMSIWTGYSLKQRIGGWDFGETREALWRGAVAALIAYGVASLAVMAASHFIEASALMRMGEGIKLIARALVFGIGGAAGCAGFLVGAAIMKLREVEGLTRRLPGAQTGDRCFGIVRLQNPNEGTGL
jgi:putative peptidoglycan lipid II flippase